MALRKPKARTIPSNDNTTQPAKPSPAKTRVMTPEQKAARKAADAALYGRLNRAPLIADIIAFVLSDDAYATLPNAAEARAEYTATLEFDLASLKTATLLHPLGLANTIEAAHLRFWTGNRSDLGGLSAIASKHKAIARAHVDIFDQAGIWTPAESRAPAIAAVLERCPADRRLELANRFCKVEGSAEDPRAIALAIVKRAA